MVGKKCDGIGPAPAPDSPLAEAAADRATRAPPKAWAEVQPSRALDATWSLIRATNAYLEANEPWKAEPGPAVDAVMGDALEALRIVAILACPPCPTTCQAVWERLGLPGQVSDQRLPGAAEWGGYPGGLPVTKGDPLFPRRSVRGTQRLRLATSTPTATSTTREGCRMRRRHRCRPCRGRDHDDHRRLRRGHHGQRPSRSPAGTTASTPPPGCTRTRRSTAWTRIVGFLDDPHVIAVGECGLDYYYDHSPRDASGRRSPPRSSSPTSGSCR